MTPEERQLITGLFDRMRGFALAGKDGEAEALIKEQVGSLPDAAYMLVQSVLVQEHALQQADSRIKALEEQVRELQAVQQGAPAASGSFLGGLFGSRAAPPEAGARGASVPAVGARATPSVYGGQGGQGAQPAWAAPQAGAPTAAPTAGAQAGGGGGFLRSAMATAAGVAGGMLAANAIGSWLGGNSSTSTGQPAQAAAADTTGASQASQAGGTQDESYHEAAHEDDGGWFGDDGGDFDI